MPFQAWKRGRVDFLWDILLAQIYKTWTKTWMSRWVKLRHANTSYWLILNTYFTSDTLVHRESRWRAPRSCRQWKTRLLRTFVGGAWIRIVIIIVAQLLDNIGGHTVSHFLTTEVMLAEPSLRDRLSLCENVRPRVSVFVSEASRSFKLLLSTYVRGQQELCGRPRTPEDGTKQVCFACLAGNVVHEIRPGNFVQTTRLFGPTSFVVTFNRLTTWQVSGFKQTNAGQMRGQRCEKEAACKLPDIGLAIAVGSTIGLF